MRCPVVRPVVSTTVIGCRSSKAPMGPTRDKTVPHQWWWPTSHRWGVKR